MSGLHAMIAAGLLAFAVGPATAEESPACASFSWPVARERSAFATSTLPTLVSGSAMPSQTIAVQIALKPAATADLPVSTPKAVKPDTFAGFVTTTVETGGAYQVTVSDEAWVDVSQDRHTALKPSAISGKTGCPEVRKSLRFTLDAGPVTIQISSTSSTRIKIGLLKID